MPILPVSRLVAENNFPKARKMLHHTYLEVLPQLLLTTMMMTTSIFLALTTKKRNPRRLPKSAKKGWTPMLPKRPKNQPSSPRLPCCLTANLGTMRPTWTQCSKLLRPSKWTASFGELANLSPWATASTNFRACAWSRIKVSIDELQEKICEFEDFVQSCD